MTSRITTVHGVRLFDTALIDTRDIRVNRLASGRCSPASREEVESLARSIREHGQRQPVECVRDTAGNLSLVFGFTRFDAIELLNEKTTDLDRVRLWCVVKSSGAQNAEDCLVHNIVENSHRNATTPMDDAVNQQRLREEFSWTNTRIAELYRISDARVSGLSKLLTLIPGIQKLVAKKQLTSSAAEDLAGLTREAQEEWLAGWNSTGEVDAKVATADVRETVAKAKLERGEKAPGMTLAALRKWLRSVATTEDPDVLDSVKAFCEVLNQFTLGEADESEVWSAFDSLTGQEKPKRRKAG